MYKQEEVPFDSIVFMDNKECVDLIEGKPMGLLSLLDEECSLGKGTDKTFAHKVVASLGTKGATYNK